jgi:hypothetical protein
MGSLEQRSPVPSVRKGNLSAVSSADSFIPAPGDIPGCRRANSDATWVNRRDAQRRVDSRLYYAITWLGYAGGRVGQSSTAVWAHAKPELGPKDGGAPYISPWWGPTFFTCLHSPRVRCGHPPLHLCKSATPFCVGLGGRDGAHVVLQTHSASYMSI